MNREADSDRDPARCVQVWLTRLRDFIGSFDSTSGANAQDFLDGASEAWKQIVLTDPPTGGTPAGLLVAETFGALVQATKTAALDYATTPDADDRMTRETARDLLTDALSDIAREAQRWLEEALPTTETLIQRTKDVGDSIKAALDALKKQIGQDDADDAKADSDPYGAVLGYHDPEVDAAIIFTKLCSFTAEENERYTLSYEQIRSLLDRELFMHISDENDALVDLLCMICEDLKERRIYPTDENAIDERRRRVRSALISFTSALQIHQDQTVRTAKKKFGRRSTEDTQVQKIFNDLKKKSFEYGWLEELRDTLQHVDINAFNFQFSMRIDGEPEIRIDMDRQYMLEATKEARNKSWLQREKLSEMTADPSIIKMIEDIQPQMREVQAKLDEIMYPNIAHDAETIKELIGRFRGRRGLYALQNGPGFTRRRPVPPYTRLAERVLDFADRYGRT